MSFIQRCGCRMIEKRIPMDVHSSFSLDPMKEVGCLWNMIDWPEVALHPASRAFSNYPAPLSN
jgi:hypothetical protein